MWSTRKRKSGSRLGHDKRDIPAFDTVSLHSNLRSPCRNYFSIITTDLNLLHFGSLASKRLLKIRHWWLKYKERKVDFRFVERKYFWQPLISPEARKERSCQSNSASHIRPRADCPFPRPAFFRPAFDDKKSCNIKIACNIVLAMVTINVSENSADPHKSG